jgi:hypothetical protein
MPTRRQFLKRAGCAPLLLLPGLTPREAEANLWFLAEIIVEIIEAAAVEEVTAASTAAIAESAAIAFVAEETVETAVLATARSGFARSLVRTAATTMDAAELFGKLSKISPDAPDHFLANQEKVDAVYERENHTHELVLKLLNRRNTSIRSIIRIAILDEAGRAELQGHFRLEAKGLAEGAFKAQRLNFLSPGLKTVVVETTTPTDIQVQAPYTIYVI